MAGTVEARLRKGRSFERQGNFAAAMKCYQALLASYPANRRANQAVLRLSRTPSPAQLSTLRTLYQRGQTRLLIELAEKSLQSYPYSEQVLMLLGGAAFSEERYPLAQHAFERLIKLDPDNATAHANLAAVYEALKQYDSAAKSFAQALILAPDRVDLLLGRGNALCETGLFDDALNDLNKYAAARPKDDRVYRLISKAHIALGQGDRSVNVLKEAVLHCPQAYDLRVDLAEALIDHNDISTATRHIEAVLAAQPNHVRALVNLGAIHLGQGQAKEAVDLFRSALETRPDDAVIWNNFATALFELNEVSMAMEAAQQALVLQQSYAKAHYTIANIYQHLGQLDRAIDSYQAALTIEPGMDVARANLLHFKAQTCDWSAYEAFDAIADTLGVQGDPVSPWAMLGFEDAPENQLKRSENFARQWRNCRKDHSFTAREGKLHIGYFSSDLYDHATLSLLNGVLEAHDKSALEVTVFGFNPPQESAQFDRMVRAVDRFVDLSDASDAQIVRVSRQAKLDIAIDLKGYTQNARPGPFYEGLAPVQINYLGYPGTLGSDAYDYLIADETVIPQDQRFHYREQVLYVPGCYQPNDRARVIGPPMSRRDCGLPEKAVVLCCFNQSYKITPREFNIWMRVLGRVDNAVLWLLASNKWAVENLRREAAKRGVAPERIIFANRLSEAQHLARHKLADLFIDTFNVNAHTTASDALFAGLPVLTRPGRQFAARVGASLCRATGMSELIADSDEDYACLLTELAQNPEKRSAFKTQLAKNLPEAPLFDTVAYTRGLENCFADVARRD